MTQNKYAKQLIDLYKTYAPDGHWFDEDTMRWFDSRIEYVGEYGYLSAAKADLTTSENIPCAKYMNTAPTGSEMSRSLANSYHSAPR